MKRAEPTDRLLVKASVIRMQDPLISRTDSIQAAVAGRVVKTGRGKPVLAYVNHSRWVADCECGGGELVTEGEDMLCGSCGMVSTVSFPTKKKLAEIERLLDLRDPPHRNWRPEETLDELVAQNIENGIWEDK